MYAYLKWNFYGLTCGDQQMQHFLPPRCARSGHQWRHPAAALSTSVSLHCGCSRWYVRPQIAAIISTTLDSNKQCVVSGPFVPPCFGDVNLANSDNSTSGSKDTAAAETSHMWTTSPLFSIKMTGFTQISSELASYPWTLNSPCAPAWLTRWRSVIPPSKHYSSPVTISSIPVITNFRPKKCTSDLTSSANLSNLIRIPPVISPSHSSAPQKIKMALLNVRSLTNKSFLIN